ncbi:hypothetical protein EVAR_24111_1 [Eumeta japonica]|uniref:Uncharacterized protein n=1 Tax=Eumeta variegata TaxID=151549 RepID=A0A4C1YR80_EUMVA|nr:hypothetical protein EVAR_24111_1 [Eumeta japonica]
MFVLCVRSALLRRSHAEPSPVRASAELPQEPLLIPIAFWLFHVFFAHKRSSAAADGTILKKQPTEESEASVVQRRRRCIQSHPGEYPSSTLSVVLFIFQRLCQSHII